MKISKKNIGRALFYVCLFWVGSALLLTLYFFQDKNFPFWVYYEVSPDVLGVPVITYHDVLNPKEFERHLQYLSENHYKTLTCDEFYAYLNGKADYGKAVVLTFDDATLNLWEVVYPLLKKYNLKGVSFIPVNKIVESEDVRSNLEDLWSGKTKHFSITRKKYTYLTWAEIKKMHNSGVIDFQSHSFNHEQFLNNKIGYSSFHVKTKDDLQSAMLESFVRSKQIIEEKLQNKEVRHFCYPKYKGSKLAVELSEKAGYVSNFWGFLGQQTNHPGDDPYFIDRVDQGHSVILSLPGKNRLNFSERVLHRFITILFPSLDDVQKFYRKMARHDF